MPILLVDESYEVSQRTDMQFADDMALWIRHSFDEVPARAVYRAEHRDDGSLHLQDITDDCNEELSRAAGDGNWPTLRSRGALPDRLVCGMRGAA